MKVAENSHLRLLLDAWRPLVRKIDPTRSRLNWRTHLSYSLSGAGHSLLNRIQQKSHEAAIHSAAPLPPVFILGFWRSGTTFLHELLCSNSKFGFPSTYACLNPSHFLLSESWARKQAPAQSRRAMDDLRYSWSSPQEDEFALLALGAPSPYEALLVPSLTRDADTLLDIRTRSLVDQDRWAETLQYFLKLLTVQQGKPMVLKSPSHGFRLPALRRLFPQARYVIIERNPYEVFASNLKLWRTLIDQYGLETSSEEDLQEFILAAYVLHEKILAETAGQFGSQSLSVVRYEELVANPLAQMERLYRELGLGDFVSARPPLEKYLQGVAGHRRNRFELSQSQKARIDAAWGELIQKKRYAWQGDYINLC